MSIYIYREHIDIYKYIRKNIVLCLRGTVLHLALMLFLQLELLKLCSEMTLLSGMVLTRICLQNAFMID